MNKTIGELSNTTARGQRWRQAWPGFKGSVREGAPDRCRPASSDAVVPDLPANVCEVGTMPQAMAGGD